MKILMHQCCAPCSVYTVKVLKKSFDTIYGYYYNPNIHPVKEFYLRLESVEKFNKKNNINSIIDEYYGLKEFVRKSVYREENRCVFCYAWRIEKAAAVAKKGNFDYFTTTLLFSKMQNHELIKELCQSFARKYGVPFYYNDFREGWNEGLSESKNMDIYRQQYCGCIYSEEYRYKKQLSGYYKKGRPIMDNRV
jgi:predicted adenine nucleotide alpha hydrolase (AANH) superfamily ATPase